MRKVPLREKLQFLALRTSFRWGSLLFPDMTARRALRYFTTTDRIPRPGWEEDLARIARQSTLKCGLRAYAWGSGPRVLLVHGWDGRATQMGKIASLLAENGFEAIAFDLPAHGESPGDVTHVVETKAYLMQVDAELGPFEAVIAHSFGACAAIFAVSDGLRTKKLVDMAGANRFTDLFDRFCEAVGVSGKARVLFERRIAEMVNLDPRTNYAAVWAEKIRQPGLIVHDRGDRDAPFSDGEAIHAAWKGSRLFATTGLGHRRILKAKEVLAEILAFVKET